MVVRVRVNQGVGRGTIGWIGQRRGPSSCSGAVRPLVGSSACPNAIISGVNTNEDRIGVDLSEAEAEFLARALEQWGGPGRLTEKLAIAMGFDDVADFAGQSKALSMSLRNKAPLSRADWTRALLASEIVFVSDVVGAGVEWPTVTGWSDLETIELLRVLQRKLMRSRALSLGGM